MTWFPLVPVRYLRRPRAILAYLLLVFAVRLRILDVAMTGTTAVRCRVETLAPERSVLAIGPV
jgi:hypothetical protein